MREDVNENLNAKGHTQRRKLNGLRRERRFLGPNTISFKAHFHHEDVGYPKNWRIWYTENPQLMTENHHNRCDVMLVKQ